MTAETRGRDRRATAPAGPDDALSTSARRVTTILGVAALWSGVQLAAVGAVAGLSLGLPPTAVPTLWYAAALLVLPGATLVSGGGRRPAAAAACLRTRDPAVAVGVGVGVALLVVLLGGTAAPEVPVPAIRAVGLAQVPLVLGWWSWAAPGRAPVVTHRAVVSSLVVTVVVGHAALIPVLLPDAYPFAIYTMFSEPRLDPYEGQRIVFVADVGTDEERTLPAPASRLALLQLAEDGANDDLRAIATSVAERYGATEVTVYLEGVQVRPPPAPPGLAVASRTELVTTGG